MSLDHHTLLKNVLNDWRSARESIDQKLRTLIHNEHFLNDLSNELRVPGLIHKDLPSATHVENTIKLHFGQAMELILLRGDGVRLPLLVPVTSRVLDLRHAVQEAITRYLTKSRPDRKSTAESSIPSSRNVVFDGNPISETQLSLRFTSPPFISWRSIWKTKCLALINPNTTHSIPGQPSVLCRLENLNGRLLDLGIRNGAIISFVNKLKRK